MSKKTRKKSSKNIPQGSRQDNRQEGTGKGRPRRIEDVGPDARG